MKVGFKAGEGCGRCHSLGGTESKSSGRRAAEGFSNRFGITIGQQGIEAYGHGLQMQGLGRVRDFSRAAAANVPAISVDLGCDVELVAVIGGGDALRRHSRGIEIALAHRTAQMGLGHG